VKPYAAILVLLPLLGIAVACREDGQLPAVRGELAALQTQVAAPTPTPAATPLPTPTPTPDLSALCDRVLEFVQQRLRAAERADEIQWQRGSLSRWTTSERVEVDKLFQVSWRVLLILPPPGADPHVHELRKLTIALKAADLRTVEAIYNDNAIAYHGERSAASLILTDVRAYWAEVCMER
jgi:hypothetical protein